MQFKTFVYLFSIVAVVAAQTTGDVLSHLATLKTKVQTLDDAINAFPDSGGDLSMALTIHNDAVSARQATDDTTSSTVGVPAPVSETDGQNILNTVQSIVPIIEDALIAIVKKKPAFDALPLGGVSGLVKQDLTNLNASTSNLEIALIGISPSDLVPQATSIKNEVNSAFATAIQAYAGA